MHSMILDKFVNNLHIKCRLNETLKRLHEEFYSYATRIHIFYSYVSTFLFHPHENVILITHSQQTRQMKKKQWGKGSISDIFSLEMWLNCIWREDVMLLLHSICWKSDKSCSKIMKDFNLLSGVYNLLWTNARHVYVPAPHPLHGHKYNYHIHPMQAWLLKINLIDIHKHHADILLM